ncbi:MAG: zinc-dependent peptidase [Schleiferiaceae bacterium]|nr:zinc-dependent peptidase [Schleiferiaceae bacterium]
MGEVAGFFGVSIAIVTAIGALALLVIYQLNNAFGLIEAVYVFLMGKPLMHHVVFRPKRLPHHEQQVLEKYNWVYERLSDRERAVFEHRVGRFIQIKRWSGRDGHELNRYQQLIIAGIAVKLTFGLRRYSMPVLKEIGVFPDVFPFGKDRRLAKGLFFPNTGQIALSWKHLMEGVEDPNDNLHLGLHEFTHALLFELHKGEWADTHFQWQFGKVNKFINKPEKFQRVAGHPYFRAYAQTNAMEFFAVAVEHFFETPEDFKHNLPELYMAFAKMLNIDPLAIKRGAL